MHNDQGISGHDSGGEGYRVFGRGHKAERFWEDGGTLKGGMVEKFMQRKKH